MNDDLFERRRGERHSSLNLLEYDVIAPDGHVEGMGMARTVNISETGLLLETGAFFEAGQQMRITVSLDNSLVKFTGRVVHSRPLDDDLCSTGVQFVEFQAEDQARFHSCMSRLRTQDEE